MKIDIVDHLSRFLSEHHVDSRPLLLGLSGGPDSLTLLHALLAVKVKHKLNIHLAHVDHRWRKESTEEAELLASKAQEWGLPFHLKILDPKNLKGSLEEACRMERLRFFLQIYAQENCQALLLAHHAQDQSETVLKRILEGGSLPFLSGIAQVRNLMGMNVWRPFLKISKSVIEEYIHTHQLHPFYDASNFDPHYLRGRIRTEILPTLSSQFGKNIEPSLTRICQEAGELKDYLEHHLEPWINRIEVSPFGSLLDLSEAKLKFPLEIKFLMRKLAESKNFSLPHSIVDTLWDLIVKNRADSRVACKEIQIEVDRGRIFLLVTAFPLLASHQTTSTYAKTTSWKEAWKGEGAVLLPEGNYTLGTPDLKARTLAGPELGKWWTDHKVPAFLRYLVPVVYDGATIVHEFLSGKNQFPNHSHSGTLISFKPIGTAPFSKTLGQAKDENSKIFL